MVKAEGDKPASLNVKEITKGTLILPSILLTILLLPNKPAFTNNSSMNETINLIVHFFDYNQDIPSQLTWKGKIMLY